MRQLSVLDVWQAKKKQSHAAELNRLKTPEHGGTARSKTSRHSISLLDRKKPAMAIIELSMSQHNTQTQNKPFTAFQSIPDTEDALTCERRVSAGFEISATRLQRIRS
jgi:hypothetical protein